MWPVSLLGLMMLIPVRELPMARLLTVLVSFVVAIPFVLAAPVPTHLMPRDPPLAFPTQVGTTWVYEGIDDERTVVISAVKELKDGSKLVTTENVGPDGKRTPDMVRRVSADGIFLVSENGQDYDEPWCVVQLPHREGRVWETRVREKGAEDVGKRTAGPIEKVRVLAGEFLAARIDWEFTRGAITYKATYWYANGIGLVQSDDLKLKSFTPGK